MNSDRNRPSGADDPAPAGAGEGTWHYRCRRSGNCCRWPGDVRIVGKDIERIAGHLGISEEAFLSRFARLDRHRTGLSLEEAPDGACIFFEGGGGCAIHPVKPSQCRRFPNDWRFPGWRQLCEAVPVPGPPPAAEGESKKDPLH